MKRLMSVVLILALILAMTVSVGAASTTELDSAMDKTAAFCLSNVPSPANGAEWLIIGLAGSGAKLPSGYLDSYYFAIEDYIVSCDGVVSSSKSTAYSSIILSVTASGHDATNVAGHDLTTAVSNLDFAKRQGLNGPVFALIALDSGNYSCNNRGDFVDYILSKRLSDGGWAFSGSVTDPDMTAMAIQALSKYMDRTDVSTAVGEALDRLSQLQNANGGYSSWGTVNSESTAQVIIALAELGIPIDDPRFVKNGKTALDDLLTYQNADGSFCHIPGDGGGLMATEQAFLAVSAVRRVSAGHKGIYSMSDKYVRTAFTDVSGHWAEIGINYSVGLGLFQGTSDTEFSPELPMNRAMLVTVLWRLDGQPEVSAPGSNFSDVISGQYYSKAVVWASANGIVDGYDNGAFGIGDAVTRQQLAALLYRYAKYKGMDVSAAADLDKFPDSGSVAPWAAAAMSWANAKGLITGSSDGRLMPNGSAARAQVAVILMRFIEGSK